MIWTLIGYAAASMLCAALLDLWHYPLSIASVAAFVSSGILGAMAGRVVDALSDVEKARGQ